MCVYVCFRAKQLLLVKIQKLVCRGGKEENESRRNSKVETLKSFRCLSSSLPANEIISSVDTEFDCYQCESV